MASTGAVPPNCPILDSTSPHDQVGTVLGVPRPVLDLDEPEAALRSQAERLGVMVHGATVGRGVSTNPAHPVSTVEAVNPAEVARWTEKPGG
jgi:hypothetical protein